MCTEVKLSSLSEVDERKWPVRWEYQGRGSDSPSYKPHRCTRRWSREEDRKVAGGMRQRPALRGVMGLCGMGDFIIFISFCEAISTA